MSTVFDSTMVRSLAMKELKSLWSQRTQEVHRLFVQPKKRRKVKGRHITDMHVCIQVAVHVLHSAGDQESLMTHIIAAMYYAPVRLYQPEGALPQCLVPLLRQACESEFQCISTRAMPQAAADQVKANAVIDRPNAGPRLAGSL